MGTAFSPPLLLCALGLSNPTLGLVGGASTRDVSGTYDTPYNNKNWKVKHARRDVCKMVVI